MSKSWITCLMGLVALQACGAPLATPSDPDEASSAGVAVSIQNANRDFASPLDLRTPHDDYDCPQPDVGVAPEAYDRQNFLKRLTRPRRYIDAECLAAVYSADKLVEWSEQGDPIARYASLVSTYDTTDKACADYASVISGLTASGDAKFRDPRSGSDVSRVPEAYVSAGVLEKVCGQGDGEAFFRKAAAEGLSPR